MAAAMLSHRYISDRFLPDKAIDLMDEACSRLRIEIDSLPTDIDVVERRIMQLEIEKQALAKESDDASRARLAKLEEDLQRLASYHDDFTRILNLRNHRSLPLGNHECVSHTEQLFQIAIFQNPVRVK